MVFFTPFAFRSIGYDEDAANFINAAQTLSFTEKQAINNLVLDLKAESLWSKLVALYPFIGANANTHRWNLINPQDTDAAFRLTFFGGVTHNANGVTGNGTNGYYNTHIIPLDDLLQDDVSGFVYNRTNTQNADFGAFEASNATYPNGSGFQLSSRNASNQFVSRVNSTNLGISTSPENTDSIGFYAITRTASGSYLKSKNKTFTTITNNSTTPVNYKIIGLNLIIGGSPFTTWSARNHALIGFGKGLTQSEVETLVDINQTYQTALGRFV
jgi:hypothetical protein